MNISIPLRIKETPDIFQKKKVFVIGDIAFDHSYYCRASQKGFHAMHANELIYDIEPWGDDLGSVGSANNVCLFTNSFSADSFLLTVIGKDNEGKRVKQILKENSVKNKCIELDGIQTITRLRFFIYNEETTEYKLAYRMDKEPEYNLSYIKSLNYIHKYSKLRNLLKNEIGNCDTLIINDTEKGFISEELVKFISDILKDENNNRKLRGTTQIKIIVDPKNHWGKFQPLPGAIIKPNLKETLKELEIDSQEQEFNPDDLTAIKNIVLMLIRKYGRSFDRYVITLGRFGVLYIYLEGNNVQLYRIPAFTSKDKNIRSAAHCGDIFSAALGLALALDNEDILSSITFANWAAFLQYIKNGREKAGLKDILDNNNFEYLLAQKENANYKTRFRIQDI